MNSVLAPKMCAERWASNSHSEWPGWHARPADGPPRRFREEQSSPLPVFFGDLSSDLTAASSALCYRAAPEQRQYWCTQQQWCTQQTYPLENRSTGNLRLI